MFGIHVDRVWAAGPGRPPMADQVQAAIGFARENNVQLRAAQIFVAGPRQRRMSLGDEEAAGLRRLVADTGLAIFAHGTYLDSPWTGDAHAAHFIREELQKCEQAGLRGLVVHVGKPSPEEIAPYLPRLMGPGPRVYLEMAAVKPSNSNYETPEKLDRLLQTLRRVADPQLESFGVCIDTAHLWSCGVDLSSYDAAQAWLDRLTVPGAALLFHLNDSRDERGSGKDHHAPLLAGKLWGEYRDRPRASGLAAFVEYALQHDIPTILERSGNQPAAFVPELHVLLELAPSLRV